MNVNKIAKSEWILVLLSVSTCSFDIQFLPLIVNNTANKAIDRDGPEISRPPTE